LIGDKAEQAYRATALAVKISPSAARATARKAGPHQPACGRAEVPMIDDHDDIEDAREPSPLNALRVSIVTLSEGLEKAFDSKSDCKDVEYERVRYIHALHAISDFLRANNAPLRYAQRWNRLAVALNDANDGRADPLLAPSSFGSLNAADPTVEWLARADAALGMAALVAGGASRVAAAKMAQACSHPTSEIALAVFRGESGFSPH